jgi:threonine/homoserine/homoserine lactone efflux protein
MAASSIAAFWVVALLLIAVPGPDWAFVLGPGLRARSVVPAAGGLALGYTGTTIVVAAGVGVLIARSPAVLTGLTIVGGCYLMWHGARTFASSPAQGAPAPGAGAGAPGAAAGAAAGAPGGGAGAPGGGAGAGAPGAAAGTGRGVLLRGMGVSALNPKGLLVFLALLPQFTNPRWGWPPAAQLGLLGAVFVLTCALFYLVLGSAAGRVLRARPAAARAVTRFSGAAMVVVGAVLLAEHFIA